MKEKTKKKPLSHTDISSLGGRATKNKMEELKKKTGKNHYSEIAKKRWKEAKKK